MVLPGCGTALFQGIAWEVVSGLLASSGAFGQVGVGCHNQILPHPAVSISSLVGPPTCLTYSATVDRSIWDWFFLHLLPLLDLGNSVFSLTLYCMVVDCGTGSGGLR